MRTQRKLFAWIMAFILTLSVMPTAALADEETSGECGAEGNNVTWKVEDDTLIISGSGAMADYSTAANVPWNSHMDNIKKGVVEEGITHLGARTFVLSKALESVSLPESLESIGESAFNQSVITFVALPSNLKTIGKNAFLKAPLTEINIPESVKNIGDFSFEGCKLTSVTMLENLETLGSGAFKGNPLVAMPEIPKAITHLASTFQNCTELAEISIPSHVTSLDRTFMGCTGLTSVTIPENVEKYNGAFNGCTGLVNVIIESKADNIGGETTNNAQGVFGGCTNLKTITVPAHVKTIGMAAFKGCSSLETVDFIQWAETIGNEAFQSSGVAGNLVLNAKTVGVRAFDKCGKLGPDISLAQVESIGGDAFRDCANLKGIVYGQKAWTAVPAQVKAILNGGIFAADSAFESGKLAIPTKVGYICGWYTKDGTDDGNWGDPAPSNPTSGTYYAKWERCTDHILSEATCTDASTCSKCGETIGEVLGHDWQEATCTAPKTCSRCGATEGNALGHSWDTGVVTTPASYTAPGVKTFTCAACNITKTESIPQLVHTSSGSSSSSSGYTVSASSTKNGTVTVSPKRADKGDTVTITVKPDTGYELDELTVTDKNGKTVKVTEGKNGKFTFTMPTTKVTVEATFVKIEEAPKQNFTDVPAGYWAKDAIAWAYENSYMNGNSAVTFNPEGTVTRQQLWMILARLSGHQPADFTEAKAWAVDNGISDGTVPGNAVSRQQLVTILYRYAVRMGYNTSARADLTIFPDHASVASYATDAMAWSVANGIVGGTTQGTLNPAGTATRAQFAVILSRFVG